LAAQDPGSLRLSLFSKVSHSGTCLAYAWEDHFISFSDLPVVARNDTRLSKAVKYAFDRAGIPCIVLDNGDHTFSMLDFECCVLNCLAQIKAPKDIQTTGASHVSRLLTLCKTAP
jgi:hypothetical protein